MPKVSGWVGIGRGWLHGSADHQAADAANRRHTRRYRRATGCKELSADQFLDTAGEVAVTADAGRAVIVDVEVHPMSGAESLPQRTVEIRDMSEATRSGRFEKRSHRHRIVAGAGNPDDSNIVSECFLDLHDRGGFRASNRSPGRPEPQHHVLAL